MVGHQGADERATGGRDLQKQRGAHIAQAGAHETRGGSGGRGDDTEQADADGLGNGQMECQRQQRHDDQAAAESGERPDQPGCDTAEKYDYHHQGRRHEWRVFQSGMCLKRCRLYNGDMQHLRFSGRRDDGNSSPHGR